MSDQMLTTDTAFADRLLADGFDGYLAEVTRLVDDELIPGETEMVTAGAVPDRLVRRLAETGLFAVSTPRELGGLGLDQEQQVRLTFEFTRASLVYRSRFSPNIGLCTSALLKHGTPEQQRDLLPRMARGELVMSFALTEPEAGSDAAVKTTAVRSGDQVVLNGTKRYITNAGWADHLVIFARLGEDFGSARGTTAFLVPAGAPGVRVTLPDQMNGHTEGPVAEIELSDVRVPASAQLGIEGEGLQVALAGINHARTHVSASCVGQATRLVSEMTAYAADRHQFGAPVADLGAVEQAIGESYAELIAARALSLQCAQEQDRGEGTPSSISAAKLFGSEMVGRVADRAVQVLGGAGIVGDHPVPRIWRDVRALRIYEGASEVHRRNLARTVRRGIEQRPTALSGNHLY